MGDALTNFALPVASGSLSSQVDIAEKQIIETALSQCAGNVAQAAELLQTPKKSLYDKLTRHGILPETFRH